MDKLRLFRPKQIFSKTESKVNHHQKRYLNDQSGLNERQQKMMAKGLPQKKVIKGVKHVVLISSGKGGVGKSTTAVNLAAAVAELNPSISVGLLDADVFGPSVPLMMNLNEKPLVTSENQMIPLVNHGVKCMSMGFLMSQESAVMWRGLMVMQAIQRLMFEVDWGPTDVLFVDTPPGTGDTHLTLIQNLFISGALVVTTPQRAALQVTRRGVNMLRKLEVPVIGLVSNMSSFVCSSCKERNDLFGPAINQFASELDIDTVQDVPLHPEISSAGDRGTPLVVSHFNSSIV